jgi:hypothetical protein
MASPIVQAVEPAALDQSASKVTHNKNQKWNDCHIGMGPSSD